MLTNSAQYNAQLLQRSFLGSLGSFKLGKAYFLLVSEEVKDVGLVLGIGNSLQLD